MNRSAPLLLACMAWPAVCMATEIPSLRFLSPRSFLQPNNVSSPAPKIAGSGQATRIQVRPKSGRFTVAPDWDLTPGVLCTREDRDFDEYRYAERIPHCRRNFSKKEKQEVSRWYGVPWEEHSKYQYDHLLSLCLGGSNDKRNLWPMIVDQARAKAKLEWKLCARLRAGRVTQKQAVIEELGWFSEHAPELFDRLRAMLLQVEKASKIRAFSHPQKT